MKNVYSQYNKYIFFLFVLGAVLFLPADSWADDNIFSQVRDKAVKVLVDSRQLVFLLGGFGLIGFAFMAVFNKISWKWFANIAIGLFLAAVMGMFIAYFTGVDELADELDYGYDAGAGLNENPGTGGSGGGGGGSCSENPSLPGCGYTPNTDPNGGPGSKL